MHNCRTFEDMLLKFEILSDMTFWNLCVFTISLKTWYQIVPTQNFIEHDSTFYFEIQDTNDYCNETMHRSIMQVWLYWESFSHLQNTRIYITHFSVHVFIQWGHSCSMNTFLVIQYICIKYLYLSFSLCLYV